MPGLIEAEQQEPVQGPGPDGTPQHEQAEGELSTGDPQYDAALVFVMRTLFQQGADQQIAKALRGFKGPLDQALCNAAYQIMEIVEDRTEGSVPDELFGLLATRVLEQVANIAEASGLKPKASDIALAMRDMLLRYMGEQGMDTSKLQAAMEKVDPAQIDAAAAGASA